jgi:hypothetical protein
MSTWDMYSEKAEAAVDAFYGEPVRLLPYRVVSGYMQGATPDTSRQTVDGVGYLVSRSAMLKGNDAMISKRLEADMLIKIQDKYLVNIRANDRIVLLDPKRNNTVCEIAYIEPSVNGRSVVHLLLVTGNE